MSSLRMPISAGTFIRSYPLLLPKISKCGLRKTKLNSRKLKIVYNSVEEEKQSEQQQLEQPIQNMQVQTEPQKQEEEKEETLGIVGTSIMWALLIFLFAGSLFFTFGRSFQEDMQPLDPQTIIEMTS
eukprot:TRINITY_DN1720_c0_g1_i3.p2 TRINITY_DN1720_c0_g1~~TRINITY_DN1720_c0_g1_i3.p2  ORF type:complete len:146 (-),score=8.21 TRINITY_DN1720_c0_g1_i3:492-872(-)